MEVELPTGQIAVFPESMSKDEVLAVLRKKFPPPEPEVSQLESGVRGAAQGATFGLGDEIVGGAKAAYGAVENLSLENLKTDYVSARDAEREANRAAEEANPKTYLAGELAGGIALPGGALKGAVTLARVAKTGAAVGAAQGLGKSEADLTEGEIVQAAKDVALGTAVGTVAGAAGKKLLDGAGSAGTRLVKRYADAAAAGFKETGGYMPVTKIAGESLETMFKSGLFAKEVTPIIGGIKTLYKKGITGGIKSINKSLDEKKIVDIIKNISPTDIGRYALLGLSSKATGVITGGLYINSLRKSVAKYGPAKLHQIGVGMEQLKKRDGFSSKWADVARPLVESLGIVGAGLAHVKLLETQPEYRAFVKDTLKDNKINQTLLFNQKNPPKKK